MLRCVNIDWLECYCLEDAIGYPHNAQYFEGRGWTVHQRDYGTKMYAEMFTLFDSKGEPYCEIRRAPKSTREQQGLFEPYACHVRLVNRSCYRDGAALSFQSFLDSNGFAFQRISRIDLCLDFERFDYGDDPQKFIQRYLAGRYAKINQARISAHGTDEWEGRKWNSLSWGAKTSMVKTRIYNKTLELKEVKDKPYIRQAWQQCGLVDDWVTLERRDSKGNVRFPVIWRLEFEIKSSTRNWFVVEDYQGDRKRIKSYKHTLDIYKDRNSIFQVFLSLTTHYFHFKHVEYKDSKVTLAGNALSLLIEDDLHELASVKSNRELQRKDRCQDKQLFNYSQLNTYYQIEKVATASQTDAKLRRLLAALYDYRNTLIDNTYRTAANTLIAKIEQDVHIEGLERPLTDSEITVLREIMTRRLKDKGISYETALSDAKQVLQLQQHLWEY